MDRFEIRAELRFCSISLALKSWGLTIDLRGSIWLEIWLGVGLELSGWIGRFEVGLALIGLVFGFGVGLNLVLIRS
jgi:hypothetical protein